MYLIIHLLNINRAVNILAFHSHITKPKLNSYLRGLIYSVFSNEIPIVPPHHMF